MVVLTRRHPNEKLPGYWEFPGGKVEEGETPQECLERELCEELGIVSKAGKIIAVSEYHYSHGSFRLLAIMTTLKDKNFSLSVHDRVEWVPIASLLEYKLAPADIPIAKVIMEKNNEL
jgi:8-oxo-dGTP diphosphatase